MKYEVEQKYVVADLSAFAEKLNEVGAPLGEPIEQVDEYFSHPQRDFAQTDEALRIRRVDGSGTVTFKGPKVDTTTKTRREIEVPLGGDQEAVVSMTDLLRALGFSPAVTVRKVRRNSFFDRPGIRIQVAVDDVEGLGGYVEVEVMSDDAGLDAARAAIGDIAQALGLTQIERRSYLELMLEKVG